MPFLFVLLLTLAALQTPDASTKDALTLLTEVSQRYADAKSYHIEAVEEGTSSNELQHSWQKTLLTAIVMPDGRYRYEGRSGFGAAIVVSDGTAQWIYHLNDRLYTQQPAPSKYPAKGSIIQQEEIPTVRAVEVGRDLARRAHRLKSATFLPDEAISVNGKSVECYVVHYSDKDLKTSQTDTKQDDILWIDKSREVVLKTLSRMETHMLTDSRGYIPIHEETIVIYPVVELNQPEPASSFTFVAPSDAKLISEFPNPFSKSPGAADLIGKPAQDLRLKSAEGKVTTLNNFRGKPVFIEFWATWCGPCVDLMPELTKLYLETEKKGLVWMSVDNNEDSSDAANFVSREHIPWPNYHDEDGSLGKAFHREGIPLGVLIDPDGKVAFYESGYEISDLRAAIAKLGPQFSSIASSSTNAK